MAVAVAAARHVRLSSTCYETPRGLPMLQSHSDVLPWASTRGAPGVA